MLRYLLLILTLKTLSFAHAAEADSPKQPSLSSPTTAKKSSPDFFSHRTDIPKSTHGDPTFKVFRVLERTKAIHPRGLKGKYEMSVAFIVEPDGTVREAKIWKTSSSSALDAAYVEMIKHWKFVPAELGGRPIPFRVVQPFKVDL